MHAQGVKRYLLSVVRPSVSQSVSQSSVCLSVVCKKIFKYPTNRYFFTYSRVISFANSPILMFMYLIIQNTLQFSVLSGLIIRSSWSSILRYHILNYVTFSVTYSILSVIIAARGVSIQRIHSSYTCYMCTQFISTYKVATVHFYLHRYMGIQKPSWDTEWRIQVSHLSHYSLLCMSLSISVPILSAIAVIFLPLWQQHLLSREVQLFQKN